MKLNRKTTSTLYKTGLLIAVIALITACSRKKNTWLSRNFHAMGTYYNILFHGEQSLDFGQQQLQQTYIDDYWEILPVERMTETGDPIVYGQMVKPQQTEMLRPTGFSKPQAASNNNPSSQKSLGNKKNSKAIADAFSAFNKGNQTARGQQNGQSQFRNSTQQLGNRNGRFGQNNGRQNGRFNQNNGLQNNQFGQNQTNTRFGSGQNNRFNGRGNAQFGGNQNNTQYSRGQNNSRYGNNGGQFNSSGRVLGNPVSGTFQGANQLNPGANNRFGANQGGRGMGQNGLSNSQLGGGFISQQQTRNIGSAAEEFERAETKAAKAIQKHNMLINGEEHNPQMDDAFLLLGKARYFDQRYFPALEAFNYVLHKYDDDEAIVTAAIWKEKVYLRLENYNRVIENLTTILNDNPELSPQNIVEASTTLAQAYINTEHIKYALKPLEMAVVSADDKVKKGRYLFIKGQIYDRLHQPDSAQISFNKIIDLKRRTPRMYRMHAFAEKIDNFDVDHGNIQLEIDTINELLANRENRPYLDVLYFQAAEFYKSLDSMPRAITYYNRALRTNMASHKTQAHIYRTLGKHYFDHANYRLAGAYYDSTMVNLPEGSREYRDVRRKRLNLNDVIFYEQIARENDSILQLVRMSPEKRLAYFENYTDSLKTIAIARAERAQKQARKSRRNVNMFKRQQSQVGGRPMAGSGFYFYNSSRVAAGEQIFEEIWGVRELQDNWRTEKGHVKRKNKDDKDDKDVNFMAVIDANPAFDPQTYLEQVPTDTVVIDSISDVRNFAYYQLGVIYKVNFKKYKLAAEKLEALLQNDPVDRLVLPSKYKLYKIYKQLGNTAKMAARKHDILTNHPESRYAKILRNPRSLRDAKNTPEQVYYSLYKKYEAGHYQEVLEGLDNYIPLFIGHRLVPKMELLKARVKGRLYGFEAYKEALNYLALTYPQSKEGEKAADLLKEALPQLAKDQFVRHVEGIYSYNLIYVFSTSEREAAEALQKKVDSAITTYNYVKLSTSIATYSPEKIFVVVRGLSSKKGAEGFGVKLKKDEDFEIKHANFGISSINYETLLIHKKLKTYLEEFVD